MEIKNARHHIMLKLNLYYCTLVSNGLLN